MDNHLAKKGLKTLGAPVRGTIAQLWLRLVHAEARGELQKRGLQIVPENSRKEEDKETPCAVKFQRKRQQMSARAMKSHTLTVSAVMPVVRHEKRLCGATFAATSGECESS